ncbi:hypothetical protein KEM48_008294 [Puccinia striiformis f. sp. tritici PST-130]|nr:hypothetical protein KEM48_008294 [Puccinia striiformis f. sp. tritici PST-130]
MGLSPNAKPEELPTTVSAEELASWDTWRERRKDAFSQRLKEATNKHPDANEQEIKHIRKSVIDQLKSRLVPVTFHAPPFAASSAVSIHRTNVDVAESSIPGIKTRFFQWITNQGLSRMKAQMTPAKWRRRGNTHIYPEKKILGHLLRDPDAVSDFEEDDANTLPRRISAHWRSPGMENIVRSLDHVAWKRAKSPQKKMSVRGLLDRKDVRAPTAEERKEQPVPARFPRDAYHTNYLLKRENSKQTISLPNHKI